MAKKREPVIEVHPFVNGEWGFRLKGANGRIQLAGEGYGSRQKAIDGAEAAQANMAKALIVVLDRNGRETVLPPF